MGERDLHHRKPERRIFNCYQTRKRHSSNSRSLIIAKAEDYSTKNIDCNWTGKWHDKFKPCNEVRLGLCRCMILTIAFIHNLMEIIFLKTCKEKRGIICKENGHDFLINELFVVTSKKHFENRSHLIENIFSGLNHSMEKAYSNPTASSDMKNSKLDDIGPSYDENDHRKNYSSSDKSSTNSHSIRSAFINNSQHPAPNTLELKSKMNTAVFSLKSHSPKTFRYKIRAFRQQFNPYRKAAEWWDSMVIKPSLFHQLVRKISQFLKSSFSNIHSFFSFELTSLFTSYTNTLYKPLCLHNFSN